MVWPTTVAPSSAVTCCAAPAIEATEPATRPATVNATPARRRQITARVRMATPWHTNPAIPPILSGAGQNGTGLAE
ncbi:hypothetical protein GCM10018954_068920 [Kutzneria kofuensis]